ncbi:MAG: type II toxin-antitoxin system VapC family toxin, partial [Deltaproteobacteria bacterium]|nr:type II toxin-antitoxin system VapC family toxin [Deltaproteobacteria bacterium]
MVGLDTGFFIALMRNSKGVKKAWKGIREQEAFPIVSVLTIGEILYLTYRIGEPEQGHKMVKGIGLAASVQAVDQNITEKAAGLKHGRGMPYVDALILA